MRIGLLGGSFNPPHLGHLAVARAVREAQGLDAVWLLPASRPPHKPGHLDMAPPQARLDMCRRTAAGEPWLEVCDACHCASSKGPTLSIVRVACAVAA